MCRLLIAAISSGAADPDEDRLCMKAGMFVGAHEDAHVFGVRESKPTWLAAGGLESDWSGRFVVLDVPDLPLSSAGALTDPQVGEDDDGHQLWNEPAGSATLTPKLFRIRRYALAVSALPIGTQESLVANGIASCTASELMAATSRIRDGAPLVL